MNLHEYQAKALLKQFGIPVPNYVVINSIEELPVQIALLNSKKYVVKAQVHAGGRGKAGGVKVVDTKDAVADFAKGILHTRLVTYQTDKSGQPVNQVMIEEPCAIKKELYLGAVLDRSAQKIVIMASTEGGVEIEKVAEKTPEKILKAYIDPIVGALPYQARDLGFQLGLNEKQLKQFVKILIGISNLFVQKDLALLEINPFVIDEDDNLICLDAKISVDDNALYRQEQLRHLRDASQEDPRELEAREWELNYVSLDGDIGCMVNGAGLAMATMDLIKTSGGNPANFLDVGGGATKERVTQAFKIILSESKVKAILVNIFGGIVRCDLIAEGIIGAVAEVGMKVPVIVRLEGNKSVEALAILKKSGLNITPSESLKHAAELAVRLAN